LLSRLEKNYARFLNFALSDKKPGLFLSGTFLVLVLTMISLQIREPNVNLFPVNDPKYLVIKTELPLGYDITKTDSITYLIEKDVKEVINETGYSDIVESVLSTIGKGAVGERETDFGTIQNKSITMGFIDKEMYLK